MKNSKLNKYLFLTILSLILFGFACSNNIESEINNLELEYLGYEYLDEQVKIYVKNYNSDKYTITLNSLSHQNMTDEKGITELFFLNKGNNNSSLSIKNNIESEKKFISKSLLNPKLNFKQVPINKYFKLKINETGHEESTKTNIRLIDISEDSRCPNPDDNNETMSNAGSCVHAPKTRLHLFIETPKNKSFDEFIYKEQLSDYEFFYGGNYIRIIEIEPDIMELNRFIPDQDYEVTFSITQKN